MTIAPIAHTVQANNLNETSSRALVELETDDELRNYFDIGNSQ